MSDEIRGEPGRGGGPVGRAPAAGVPGLLAALCVGAVVWLVILPLVARGPAVGRHLRFMDDAAVNPSAMYYTELDRLPLRPSWADRHLVLWP